MTYSKINEVHVQGNQLSRPDFFLNYLEANIPLTDSNRILVQSGDVIGFYNLPDTDHYVRTIRTARYVLYSFDGSTTTTSLNLNDTIHNISERQPLIQFTLGK